MVVDLLGFLKMDDQTAIQEATSQGCCSDLAPTPSVPVVAPTAVSQISITALASYVSHPQSLTLDFTKPNAFASNTKASELDYTKDSFIVSSSLSFMSSVITWDGSSSLWKLPSFSSRFRCRRPILNRVLWFQIMRRWIGYWKKIGCVL